MIRKQGKILCEAYLEFVRTLPCPCKKASPPSQAHHWPPKGRRRDIDDTKTIPVCVSCHQRCHGTTVVRGRERLLPIAHEEQDEASYATLGRFMRDAPRESVVAYLRAHGFLP